MSSVLLVLGGCFFISADDLRKHDAGLTADADADVDADADADADADTDADTGTHSYKDTGCQFWYRDCDDDGAFDPTPFCSASVPPDLCAGGAPPASWSQELSLSDCDDANALVFPGSPHHDLPAPFPFCVPSSMTGVVELDVDQLDVRVDPEEGELWSFAATGASALSLFEDAGTWMIAAPAVGGRLAPGVEHELVVYANDEWTVTSHALFDDCGVADLSKVLVHEVGTYPFAFADLAQALSDTLYWPVDVPAGHEVVVDSRLVLGDPVLTRWDSCVVAEQVDDSLGTREAWVWRAALKRERFVVGLAARPVTGKHEAAIAFEVREPFGGGICDAGRILPFEQPVVDRFDATSRRWFKVNGNPPGGNYTVTATPIGEGSVSLSVTANCKLPPTGASASITLAGLGVYAIEATGSGAFELLVEPQ